MFLERKDHKMEQRKPKSIEVQYTLEELGENDLLAMAEILKIYARNQSPEDWQESQVRLDYSSYWGKPFLVNDEFQVMILKDGELFILYSTPHDGKEGSLNELTEEFYNDELKDLDEQFTGFDIEKLKSWNKEDVEFILSKFEDIFNTSKYRNDFDFQDKINRIKIYLIDKIMANKDLLTEIQKEILKLVIAQTKDNLCKGDVLDKERIISKLDWFANENGFANGGLSAFKGLEDIEKFAKSNMRDIKQNIQEYEEFLGIKIEDLLFEDAHYSANCICQICSFETSKIIEKI